MYLNREGYIKSVGRDSVIGVATRYGLDGLGIETRWGWDLPHLSIAALGPTHPHTIGTWSLSRGWRGRDVTLTIHPHLVPTLKKEYSCTYTPPLGLYGQVECEHHKYAVATWNLVRIWELAWGRRKPQKTYVEKTRHQTVKHYLLSVTPANKNGNLRTCAFTLLII